MHLLPNFVAISQTIADIWRFINFFNMAAVRHLGFVMRVFGPFTAFGGLYRSPKLV